MQTPLPFSRLCKVLEQTLEEVHLQPMHVSIERDAWQRGIRIVVWQELGWGCEEFLSDLATEGSGATQAVICEVVRMCGERIMREQELALRKQLDSWHQITPTEPAKCKRAIDLTGERLQKT